jgi:hypothetical protein
MTEQRERARAKLAASFVAVVASAGAGGCTKTSGQAEPRPESQSSIVVQPDGTCRLYQSMSCPENATCNPPPARELDCPPDQRSANSRVLPEHDQRPPGKEGWLRFRESFWVGNATCSYTSDQLCPPLGGSGTCIGAKFKELPCPTQGGVHLPRTVPAFEAERAAGSCVAYPEFSCSAAGCQLPEPSFVACGAAKPPEPVVTAAPLFQGSVFKDPRGVCQLVFSPSCPAGATCNPPPPMAIDCPPEQGPDRPGLADAERPAGKEQWLRVRPLLFASETECNYQVDRFCPKPGLVGTCDTYRNVTLPCSKPGSAGVKAPPGKEQYIHVPAFEVPRAAGKCAAYPATFCEPNRPCELPVPRVVACKAELAR